MSSFLSRDEAIKRIRTGLRARTGKDWSVTCGRGTSSGWIKVTAPPRRQVDYGYLSVAERAELGKALGLPSPAHQQGVSIPGGSDYYAEYVDRAEGRKPSAIGKPWWD